MATNEVFDKANTRTYPVGSPTASGDPVVVGQIPGVAQTARDSNGNATVAIIGSHLISVKGINAGGNSAVAVGDALYFTAGDTPPVSKKATGVLFGYAEAAVNSAATATISVLLPR
jgi:hypothetical protein